MGRMNEYVQRKLGANELENELVRLISEYNKLQGTYLVVFVTSTQKRILEAQLDQDDYFMIADMLSSQKGGDRLDFYIETPGGSGETAEEIVRFLHSNFTKVNFVVSGEAKSAGTIMVLSGHEIFMTDTGSLGPIDAQIYIGRSQSSAYDYMAWVEEKQEKAEATQSLNPFEAIMVAQISPGELNGVSNSLEFAKDLVVEWLTKYKFADWNETAARKLPVTHEMKQNRAKEIADQLCNHALWRSHGRSIKIIDLETIKLKVNRIDDNPAIADIVYRIQTVCRLLFSSTTAYKIYATEHEKLFKHAVQAGLPSLSAPVLVDAVEINQVCPQCGTNHKIFCKLKPASKMNADHIKKGFIYYPKNDKLKCKCGFEIDLSGIRNQIEMQIGKKIIK
ncbi:MAG TPA: peptidase [Rikenellaceae bacterium]|nr:peptidase [Rikenellaceae bacterium]